MNNENVIHRDVKLENILMKTINNRVIPKIADFGLSKFGGVETKLGAGGNYIFKPPEIDHDDKLTCESEVFSYGLLFLSIILNQ